MGIETRDPERTEAQPHADHPPAPAPAPRLDFSPRGVLALQRTSGNQAVTAMLQGPANGSAPASAGPPPGLGAASETDSMALLSELGGRGAGPLQPSRLAEGLATFEAAGQAVQLRAAQDGEHRAAGAAVPEGPAAEPSAAIPEPVPPPISYAAPAAAPGGEPGVELEVGGTLAELAEHATGVETAAATAAHAADAQAAALSPGPLAPTQPAAPVQRPPAAPLAPWALPAVPDVPLEAPVAAALDAGYSAELSTAAAKADEERGAAAAEYAAMLDAAEADHQASAAVCEADAGAQVEAARAQGGAQVEARRTAWRGENAGLLDRLRTEVGAERAAATADVDHEARAASSAAAQLVADAYGQAGATPPAAAGTTSAGETAPGPATAGTAAPAQASAGETAPAPAEPGLLGGALQAGADLFASATDALSDLAADARALVETALDQAQGLLDAARQLVADRIARYAVIVAGAVASVRDGLAEAASRAVAAIREAVESARAALDGIVAQLRELGTRLLGVLRAAIDGALDWLTQKLVALAQELIALGQTILGMADAVRQLLAAAAHPFVRGLASAGENLAGFLEPFEAQIGAWLGGAPAASREQFDRLVGPLAAGGERSTAAATGGGTLQRSEVPDAVPDEPTQLDIAWEYVKDRLAYLWSFWPSVIGNILLEMVFPVVSLIRHLPALLVAIFSAFGALFTGRFSDWIDQSLLAVRELWAMVSILIADFMVIAFIAGSILGTPIIGEGAMVAIGVVTLAADVVIGAASIGKAWWNLNQPGRTDDQLHEDYSVIGDSVVSLGITTALLVLAVAGQMFGKMLIARFPRVATTLDDVRMRLRAAAGLKKAEPNLSAPQRDLTPSPPATEFPGRADLTPLEQRAFDRFVASKRAGNQMTQQLEDKLMKATADELRKICRNDINKQPQLDDALERRQRADETNASDPLRPKFKNERDEGGGVTSYWNEEPPAEVPEGLRIAGYTDEPVSLFGDRYPTLDGTIGAPSDLRGLQIKTAPNTPDEAFKGALDSFETTRKTGYPGIETHVMAENWKLAQIEAAFAKPGVVVDGYWVRAVKVWCEDGVFFPTPAASPPIPTPPVHPELGEE